MTAVQAWRSYKIGDCIARPPAAAGGKVFKRDYKPGGRFPVIDQGQEMVAGWTDDEAKVIESTVPLIVFGDHTRAFKFVDFPFAQGADGTQLLRPIAKLDPLFFYYACKALSLPNRGYNRHFGILKESSFSAPEDRAEQALIGGALKLVQHVCGANLEALRTCIDLKNAAIRSLFTRGLRREVQKETEIGPVPESWDICAIEHECSVSSGGTPSRDVPAFWIAGTIPWVKTAEIDYSTILDTEEKITEAGLANSAAKLLEPGAVLVAMYGQGVTRGKAAILGIRAATNQACAALRCTSGRTKPRFLLHHLAFSYERLRSVAHGGQQKNLNLDLVGSFRFARPTIEEQEEITRLLDTIDLKIDLHRKKHVLLDELFRTLLHKLMTGEIRVADLDLSALEAFPAPHASIETSP